MQSILVSIAKKDLKKLKIGPFPKEKSAIHRILAKILEFVRTYLKLFFMHRLWIWKKFYIILGPYVRKVLEILFVILGLQLCLDYILSYIS